MPRCPFDASTSLSTGETQGDGSSTGKRRVTVSLSKSEKISNNYKNRSGFVQEESKFGSFTIAAFNAYFFTMRFQDMLYD